MSSVSHQFHDAGDSSAPAVAIDPDADPTPDRRVERGWVVSLFGTAVGAGVLFLPIKAGLGGVWPLVIATLLIAPMTYFSHRALSRFVCASPNPGDDITAVARSTFGPGVGGLISVLYFLAIYPIVLIYGVSITNTVDSFMVNQLGLASLPRPLLSFVLIALMMAVMIAGQKLMLAITGWLVYPLILILFGASVYLIPSWKPDALFTGGPVDLGGILLSTWLVIPVLVFAFNHSPAISQFSLAMQRQYGAGAATRASAVLAKVTGLLVVFTMFFVWSCVLALGPDGMAEAQEQNLPVLSYLANVHGSPLISLLGPVVAFLAIVSSFFGHYLGAAEGAAGVVRSLVDKDGSRISDRTLRGVIAVVIFFTTWAAAIANPSVLGLIETVGGPVIAMILFLMPIYAIHRLDALAPYRGKASNVFVVLAGLAAVSALVYGIVRSVTGA
ncbi:HAAAP family serine/threonine permease [Micrococcus sp. EYE_162]|uniref:HAAAP family serine/threonine permease n=1 Tax=unclassified Micrococcus TaxID=2620948 RepID=UPI0020057F1D|nr:MULTISPECIES: HAAAP family serine/threonine permease [unclassified Micrococcus]MCK6095630.1 HAAAP family serine/threonine permease [Micrococcus sp. EYE_212]MCK6171705.1 HAAAP family serine/threonine permease [Micrococcus sp. EYE_162]